MSARGMSETIARPKFACPACGAEGHWEPGKRILVCVYCGSDVTTPEVAPAGVIHERDLVLALQESEPMAVTETDRKPVRCSSCEAITLFEANQMGRTCSFCGSVELVALEHTDRPIKPESVLPFVIEQAKVPDLLREWYRTRFMGPNDLDRLAATDTVRGLYLPYWTFDANAEADWTADAGYHHFETETYVDAQGRARTRRVMETDWRPASGSVSHVFDDELVAGTRGVNRKLLREIEPFPTDKLLPYDPQYLAGWPVELYQVDLATAANESRVRMDEQLERICAKKVPGDTYRGLEVKAEYSQLRFKHILVPVWLLTYRYEETVFQLLVNGQTGKVAGDYPLSTYKVMGLVALITLAGLALYFYLR